MTDDPRRTAADYLAALDAGEREQFLDEALNATYEKQLAAVRQLFGDTNDDTEQTEQPEPPQGNVVPREGNTPRPREITDDRATVRQLFSGEPPTWS